MEDLTKHPALGPYELSQELYYLTPPPFRRTSPAGRVRHGRPEPGTVAAVLAHAAAEENQTHSSIRVEGPSNSETARAAGGTPQGPHEGVSFDAVACARTVAHPTAEAGQPPGKPKLLVRVREAIRMRQYSLRTEQAYVQWIKRYIFFHKLRHPADLGTDEIRAYLSHLAVRRQVSASTQNQAFAALLFLYRRGSRKGPRTSRRRGSCQATPASARGADPRGGRTGARPPRRRHATDLPAPVRVGHAAARVPRHAGQGPGLPAERDHRPRRQGTQRTA